MPGLGLLAQKGAEHGHGSAESTVKQGSIEASLLVVNQTRTPLHERQDIAGQHRQAAEQQRSCMKHAVQYLGQQEQRAAAGLVVDVAVESMRLQLTHCHAFGLQMLEADVVEVT